MLEITVRILIGWIFQKTRTHKLRLKNRFNTYVHQYNNYDIFYDLEYVKDVSFTHFL